MSFVPVIPDSAPFTPEQRSWLNGFLAGLFSRAPGPANSAAAAPAEHPPLQPLTIVFGSQTGTAESLARKAAKEAGRRGFAPAVLDMAQANLGQLASVQNLLVITSTYGDGDPPDNAKVLHAALHAEAFRPAAGPGPLVGLRFSVCGLGDTNYAQFCRCAKDFDSALEKLGGTRVATRAECDVEYEATFGAWLEQALTALAPTGREGAATESSPASEIVPRDSATAQPGGHSRSHPFPAPVLAVRRLSGPGSAKEVNHVEFSIEDSGLAYEPGDALGVFPQNCPELVAGLLDLLGCDGEEAVPAPDGAAVSLRRALTEYYDLGKPTPELLALTESRQPAGPSPDQNTATAAVAGHHIIDVLARLRGSSSPARPPAAAEFVRSLRKLQPRLYSIASSPVAHAGQVHLTVGAVRYELDGRARKGVCSTFLAERALAAGRVGVFVHRNTGFRLPADDSTPVIMVGPGTGIAPFRGFLAHRQATGARGRNWLFFGDQREAVDFLYREELLALQQSGVLVRLDLAWSRDQTTKVYVQHRMVEHSAELFAWLEQGAHLYVCGDAARMAKDVDAALHRVIETAGGMSADNAAAYVQALRAAKRYQRDVY